MDGQWVELRRCGSLHEALFLAQVLEAEGIEAMVPDEYSLGVQPHLIPLVGGARLVVRADDVPRATELLESAAPPMEDGGDDQQDDED